MSNPLKIPCIVKNGLPSSLKPEDFKQMQAKATESGFPVIFQEGEKAYRVLALVSEGSFF
ncbi:hypothetical protein JQC92_00345 [Shewanella sp. 202IG2-18]|uniref:hypothetical protein n=1 Tax=Parashewanella hymeniacidonis TaxID=2807618 RepID=UPI00195F9079|nr:hypothetical protein [Parashewanella hymeniacidonis]MBM7070502.1 hypothetical protein [Parashewanella hymeniacidonis]